jgi:hypothetical protein
MLCLCDFKYTNNCAKNNLQTQLDIFVQAARMKKKIHSTILFLIFKSFRIWLYVSLHFPIWQIYGKDEELWWDKRGRKKFKFMLNFLSKYFIIMYINSNQILCVFMQSFEVLSFRFSPQLSIFLSTE